MLNQSLWRDVPMPATAATQFPQHVDVVIIGGGITGLTAAWLLKQEGKTVAVVEREYIGSGESGNTSAHLTAVTDLRLHEMASHFGDDAARLIWDGNARAIDLIETNVLAQRIDCGFTRVPGFLCSPFEGDKDDADALQKDADVANRLGIVSRYMSSGPVTGKPALSFADQALFHPLRYLAGLVTAVHGNGSFVLQQAEASQVLQDPLTVVVNCENIACNDVLVATHVPIVGSANLLGAALLQTKLYPYSSYVLGARVNGAISPGLYSDTSNPYYYLRVHQDAQGPYAIFGGCDHKTGVETNTDERYRKLEEALARIMPSAVVERRWSGQVIETADGLPYIGKVAEHQYSSSGYAGNGLTFGTLGGMMMCDAVAGRENPLAGLLDPHRKAGSLSALGTFISENVSYPYHMIRDRLHVNSGHATDNIAPGDGQVLLMGGKRVACHRADDGTLVKVSAVCTHLGCLVRWNGAERTWDCPCHGSRFTAEGLVLGGPAESPLERIDG